MAKYQVVVHVGEGKWQAIGCEDYAYNSYTEAQASLDDTLERFAEDPTAYKIVKVNDNFYDDQMVEEERMLNIELENWVRNLQI